MGVVQMFVYGGGIMVLFLFVIMLVNLQRAARGPADFNGQVAIGAGRSAVLLTVALCG